MTMTDTLHRLLDAEAGFAPDYGGGLANHRPMALHALARLGAPDERLQAYAQAYESRLSPAEAVQPWPPGQPWADYLGHREAWPKYRDLFAQWIVHESAGDLLQQALPRLMLGVGGTAFHGFIRTAHAVAATHRAELVDALATWAAGWRPLGQALPTQPTHTDDPETLLRRLKPVRGAGGFISHGQRAAAAAPGFDRLAAGLALSADTLPRLARLAGMAYAASGNFTVLHLVTSSLAMIELERYLDPDEPERLQAGRAAYWRAFAAAVAAAGIVVRPPLALRPWPALVAEAIAQDDDHVIKLVDACVQHAARDPDGPWQAAATRALA